MFAFLLALAANPDDAPQLAGYYGFTGVEVFKLAERAGSLLSGDFNHDGRTDLVIVNHRNHRLDVLLQRAAPSNDGAALITDRSPNTLADPWRFETLKIPVDYDVASLAVGDFNGNGRTDLAYFGTPDQLIVRYQPASGGWTEKLQLRVPDVLPTQWGLAAGDMNHDGRTDLVILGKRETLVFHQRPQGGFTTPVKLMNTSDKLGLAQVADLDGDGRADLCYVAGEAATRRLGVRLQDAQGRLGPEFLFDLEQPRSVTMRNVDGQPGSEILLIDSRTGRLKIMKLQFGGTRAEEIPDRLVRYGFGGSGSGRDRDWALGDFDRDGPVDIAVSDPDASQVLIFRQQPQRGLDLGTPFASLAGADGLHAITASKAPASDLVVQSTAEKMIGVARWNDGRLKFPETLPVDVEPVATEVLDITGDSRPEILFLSRSGKGRDSEYALWAYGWNQGKQVWIALPEYPVPVRAKTTPDRLLAADVTGDGVAELLVLQEGKPPTVLKKKDDGAFAELPVSGNLSTGSVSSEALVPVRWKGVAGLLVPQDNFARLMHISPEARWQIAEQFNVTEGGAKVAGAAAVQLDAASEPDLAIVDTGVKKLRLFRGGTTPRKEIDLGDFEFKSLAVADLNGDGRDDLALFGGQQLAVLYSTGISPQLQELAAFETALDKAFLSDVSTGDINGDGKIDLVLTDTRSHNVEILRYRPPARLQSATYFKLFEEKTLNATAAPGVEPREMLIVDVTGDGREDLVLLAHDRLLVYPQDPGPEQQLSPAGVP